MAEILAFGMLWLGVYIIPSIVAYSKGTKRRHAICVLNILLGWTLLGWIGALIWAIAETKQGE